MTGDQTLIGDETVTTVPVFDCGEPLVDAGEHGLLIDARLADVQGLHRYLRRGVVRRLQQAQTRLPAGWRFAVIEGYRPLGLQRHYFQAYRNEVLAADPSLTPDEVYRLTTRHIAPVLPDGHPPHSTGGAVDLTLLDADGAEVSMGCPVNATPEESDGACYTDAAGLPASERHHRDLLVNALSGAGLVNYAPEWWHWSYGDQYWALVTGAPATRYARVPERTVLDPA